MPLVRRARNAPPEGRSGEGAQDDQRSEIAIVLDAPAGAMFAHQRDQELRRLEELESPCVRMTHLHRQLVAMDAAVEVRIRRRWHER
jgi:hypothetical protein